MLTIRSHRLTEFFRSFADRRRPALTFVAGLDRNREPVPVRVDARRRRDV
jgi:hypothetical protein